MRIKLKLMVLSLVLALVPMFVVGVASYNILSDSVDRGIEERLIDQAREWRLLIKSYNHEIEAQESSARQISKGIVTSQAKGAYDLIQKALDDNGGVLDAAEREDILERLSGQSVGDTGYVWVLDYDGYYVLSRDRERDGEYVWEIEDSEGNRVIQDLVKKGEAVGGKEIAYHSYLWKNLGEDFEREKLAAMIHFPELGWVVGFSSYYDDLIDTGYREKTIESVKNLVSNQKVGKTGYIWAVDSDGVYQVSKDRERDGESINDMRDEEGVFFIQEAIAKAKASGDDAALQKYLWRNAGDDEARMTIAGVSYISEWDWVIGVSAYYDDFEETKQIVRTLVIVMLLTLVISAVLALYLASRISQPLTKLKGVTDQISKGNLDIKMPEIETKDEIYDLNEGIKGVLAAVEFLTGEVEGKDETKKDKGSKGGSKKR